MFANSDSDPRRYDVGRLGPRQFRLWSCGVRRVDAGQQREWEVKH